MLFKKVLATGVALAAVVSTLDAASAGQRWTWRQCWPIRSFQQQGQVYRYSSPAPAYTPSPAPVVQEAPRVGTSGPPAAPSGNGVTQRFSYEPGTEGAAAAPTAAPSVPAYRPAAAVRSQNYPSSSPPRNPVERRLRPGKGWQR